MDARFAFEVLLYLNVYFYPMFAVANIAMWIAKFTSTVFPTPNIGEDACVMVTLVTSELSKILLFRKFKGHREGLSVILAVIFTVISTICCLYVFIIQFPVLKLEYSLDAIMFVLLLVELAYGVFAFVPACNRPFID